MNQARTQLGRLLAALLAIMVVCGGTLATPARYAYADDAGIEATLFRATFGSATIGPLTAPLQVETGEVVREEGTVAVVDSSERVLEIDGTGGQATALLRWNNYPGALPGAPPPAVRVQIEGEFSAEETDAGASFGIWSGSSFFELFSFGPGGQITHDGNPVGLTYAANQKVKLEARVLLPGGSTGNVQIKLDTGAGQRTLVEPLNASFTAATLNQLRFRAPSGSGTFTADNLLVKFEQAVEQEDDDPPARIEIDNDDIDQEFERIGGVLFVNIRVTINSGDGGKARGTFLVLDLDDLDDLELADVAFLTGVGFVREVRDGKVYIGLGRNNIVYGNSNVQVKIKLKVKGDRINLRYTVRMRLNYRDTSGSNDIALVPVIVVLPGTPTVPVMPIGGTVPISGTTPISATAPVSGTTLVRLPITRIDVRFRTTWQRRGGLVVFGLPLTEPISRTDGLVVQYFERARLEYHPANRGTPYEVLLGRLAVELGYATPPSMETPPTSTTELRWYFPATGHLIATPFRSYWQARGGLLIFGLPISPPREENGLVVQYFERARLELHPDLRGTPYEVQIGLLGVEAYQQEDDD
jgi:hypothetical protein